MERDGKNEILHFYTIFVFISDDVRIAFAALVTRIADVCEVSFL